MKTDKKSGPSCDDLRYSQFQIDRFIKMYSDASITPRWKRKHAVLARQILEVGKKLTERVFFESDEETCAGMIWDLAHLYRGVRAKSLADEEYHLQLETLLEGTGSRFKKARWKKLILNRQEIAELRGPLSAACETLSPLVQFSPRHLKRLATEFRPWTFVIEPKKKKAPAKSGSPLGRKSEAGRVGVRWGPSPCLGLESGPWFIDQWSLYPPNQLTIGVR